MNKELENKLEEIKSLCKKYDVATMYVFGSVCTDKFNDKSDIDFLISFAHVSGKKYAENYFDLYYSLEHLFNRKIDLVTEKSLSNPYFIQSIDRNKQLIYAA